MWRTKKPDKNTQLIGKRRIMMQASGLSKPPLN